MGTYYPVSWWPLRLPITSKVTSDLEFYFLDLKYLCCHAFLASTYCLLKNFRTLKLTHPLAPPIAILSCIDFVSLTEVKIHSNPPWVKRAKNMDDSKNATGQRSTKGEKLTPKVSDNWGDKRSWPPAVSGVWPLVTKKSKIYLRRRHATGLWMMSTRLELKLEFTWTIFLKTQCLLPIDLVAAALQRDFALVGPMLSHVWKAKG